MSPSLAEWRLASVNATAALPPSKRWGSASISQGCTQLSMNILDHQRTPLWRVWEEAQRLAAEEHVSVLDSELVGLLPAAALVEVADHIGSSTFHPAERRVTEAAAWLRIRRFDPDMILEVRLEQARARSRIAGTGQDVSPEG